MKTAFSVFLLFLSARFFCQDTTKILFIGNSFTYYNNMPQMVKALADSAGIFTDMAMHAPGGISVGDIAQGTQAHMNNPILYALIRSKKWDFVVIQDNQGRFVRDSAQFPTTSLVKQGHLKLMDSIKANNSCAKLILFGGWAWKYGMPPYGNTGIECIQRILRNYVVLNDTMKEVIAPIGEAWIKAVNYLPAVNLWDADDAHPAYAGSYLTASVIFSTLFNLPAKPLNVNGGLPPASAIALRAFGDSVVFDPVFHLKYNLGGVRSVGITASGGQLSVAGTFSAYQWYQNNVPSGNGSVLNATAGNRYWALLRENDGCFVKTCDYTYSVATGFFEKEPVADFLVYPNPAPQGYLVIRGNNLASLQQVELYNPTGEREEISMEMRGKEMYVVTRGLKTGCYLLLLRTQTQVYSKTVMVIN